MHDRNIVKRYMKWNRYWCFGRVYKLSVQQINYTHSLSLKFGWWIYFWFGILVCWICLGYRWNSKKKTKSKTKRNENQKNESKSNEEKRKSNARIRKLSNGNAAKEKSTKKQTFDFLHKVLWSKSAHTQTSGQLNLWLKFCCFFQYKKNANSVSQCTFEFEHLKQLYIFIDTEFCHRKTKRKWKKNKTPGLRKRKKLEQKKQLFCFVDFLCFFL